MSSREVGGMGLGHRAAAEVVEQIAKVRGSTAMVVCMHYAGTAVIETNGPRDTHALYDFSGKAVCGLPSFS